MKIYIILISFAVLFVSCKNNQNRHDVKNKGLIYNKRISFDTINYIPYNASFVFFNSSNDTVFVDTVTYSCTCVKLLKKFAFIPPNSTDSIKVSLSFINGYISRNISVILEDQQEPLTLIIDGYINVEKTKNRVKT
jgi:hypothetical protein